MSESSDVVPPDYARLSRRSPVTDPWEPLYYKTVGNALFIAIRVREAHCNGKGFVHGGLFSALADNAMGYSIQVTRKQEDPEGASPWGVTVHLSVDFLGRAHVGEWLEFQPRVLRVGGNLAFADCLVNSDGKLVARADAAFRIGKRDHA